METLNKNIIEKPDRPIKIVQMGEGNFLRGFIDYFINELNKNTEFNGNIAMIQPRNTHKISRFNTQDCLYNVITEGVDKGQLISYFDTIDSIGCVIDPYDNYDKFLNLATNKDVKIFVSNTTESGIYYEESDNNLQTTPISFPAKLLAFLHKRYEYFNGSSSCGIHILPCELIDKNGDKLKEILINLAKLNGLGDKFIEWMTNSNKFYNTLVDRIIPGFPKDDIEKWQNEWGYIDNFAVKGEVYHLWCIEGDKSILDELPLEKTNLNIVISDDISPYKERKVKILNGSHTFLLPIAYLSGYRVVNNTISEDWVKNLLNKFLDNEVLPTIKSLSTEEVKSFRDAVIDRFANPTIQHEWTSIMLNSMSKYKERILPSVRANDNVCKYSLFSLAALFSLYKLNVKQNNELFSDSQEFLDMYNRLFNGSLTNEQIITELLDLEYWEYNFNNEEQSYVIECFNKIEDLGMKEALTWLESK